MLGAIIGDIVGSRFEFSNRLSKNFTFFHPKCTFTDDTVMTCAVAQALLDCAGDYSLLSEKAVDAMQRIGRQYPDCGYGGRFFHWMFGEPTPYGSYGNGSAMRVSPAAFAARTEAEAIAFSDAVTAVSHNHPEGLKGAEATSVAIFMARSGADKADIRRRMETDYYALPYSVDDYRARSHGHGGETCQVSLPQALTCFFEGEDFEDVIRNCISIGGDSDTLGAIAGAIAEAYYGVPEDFAEMAYSYLDERLGGICRAFRAAYMN